MQKGIIMINITLADTEKIKGDIEATVVELLIEKNITIATAESCTGGMLSQRITSVSGASAIFSFGCCTYANTAKEKVLGVSHATLESFGAVSPQTAEEMAVGIQKAANADIGVAITGIAGPTGGSADKPIGLIYISAAYKGKIYTAKLMLGSCGREKARHMAAQQALQMVFDIISARL